MDCSETDWNSNKDFFSFTIGRFIVEEAENLRERHVKFDMNRLAGVAAESVGARRCVSIVKYTSGMFNKAFLMTMDDGRDVVAKVPNPNAGIPHLTMASEVATMDFMRNVLNTPVPRVYAWNSHAESHPVGSEFIIMEKVAGVPLSRVWHNLDFRQKLPVLYAFTRLHQEWLSVSFSHYGSLYYTMDAQQEQESNEVHIFKDGNILDGLGFTVGPSTARDWDNAGRSKLDVNRGPWDSLTDYLLAVGIREQNAIHCLKSPKQIAMFCGPGLYQPDKTKKLTALAYYQKIASFLIPSDSTAGNPSPWHDDLHGENIFVDPQNPWIITGIIDWQSSHISPLFNHFPDPFFVSWDYMNQGGLEPERLELIPSAMFYELPPDDYATRHKYALRNAFIGWRILMKTINPALYEANEFQKTKAFGLISLARNMLEQGESHFLVYLVELRDSWASLPAVPSNMPFPFDFSGEDIQCILLDVEAAVAGANFALAAKNCPGRLWPYNGFIDKDKYDECKGMLDVLKGQMIEILAETDEDRAEYERAWPFD